MGRMTGMDAAFLHMETPAAHMHTLKVLVFSGGPAPSASDVETQAERWLAALPILEQRVEPDALGLAQPSWVADAEFDIHRHVHFTHLQRPGTQAQLNALVSRVASHQLPRDRPLWEAVVVDGLAGARWALILKLHHALADGAATVRAFTKLLDEQLSAAPAEAGPSASSDPWWRRALASLTVFARTWRLLPTLLAGTVAGLLRVRRRRRDGKLVPAGLYEAPRTSFNRALSSERIFETTGIELERIKALKVTARVTFNDMVLSLVSTAMRRYLAERGELPDRPLVASVPLTLPGERPQEMGNAVSTLFAALHVQEADAIVRTERVRASMNAAKDELVLLDLDARGWAELLPPALVSGFLRLTSWLRIADVAPSPINMVVSNVPGPRTLTYGRQTVEAIYSVGPLIDGIGVNITVWSYRDQVYFGMLADPRHGTDLVALQGHIHAAAIELEAAYRPETPTARPGGAKLPNTARPAPRLFSGAA